MKKDKEITDKEFWSELYGRELTDEDMREAWAWVKAYNFTRWERILLFGVERGVWIWRHLDDIDPVIVWMEEMERRWGDEKLF